MSIFQKFIDKGFYTIPMKGSIERREDGSKTKPEFPMGYTKTYKSNRNTEVAPIGGLFTGSINNIVAFDCDNDETFRLFKALDPDYDFVFKSIGKSEGGGTIIYKYDDRIRPIRHKDGHIKLDVFTDTGFIYLPTEQNKSKDSWEGRDIPDIAVMPDNVFTLYSVIMRRSPVISSINSKSSHRANLNLLVTKFIQNDEAFTDILLKIITPKDFRSLPQYIDNGKLHPNEVPQGRGSEYLSKVSAILGADSSINESLYNSCMLKLNNMWESPMDNDVLLKTILNPMVERRSSVGDTPIWNYDPKWNEKGVLVSSQNGDMIEIFYHESGRCYYCVNHSTEEVLMFSVRDFSNMLKHLCAVTNELIKKENIEGKVKTYKPTYVPNVPFGQVSNNGEYNLFHRSKYIAAMNGVYTSYKTPEITLKYIETLINDKNTRDYFMSFIKTKFNTFEYSPVILYFLGVGGSGKDILGSMFNKILTSSGYTRPAASVFLGLHNGHLLGKYIVHCDEYGNQLKGLGHKDQALGIMKSISGNPTMQIRQMRREAYDVEHSITLLCTNNKNNFPIEEGDRRFLVVDCFTKLRDMSWVEEAGGMNAVQQLLVENELFDFCCYIHDKVPLLSKDEYHNPPYDDAKKSLIINSSISNPIEWLVNICKIKDFSILVNKFEDCGMYDYSDGWDNDHLSCDKVYSLINEISSKTINPSIINGVMRSNGFTKFGKGGRQYWQVQGLEKFSGFTAINTEEVSDIGDLYE